MLKRILFAVCLSLAVTSYVLPSYAQDTPPKPAATETAAATEGDVAKPAVEGAVGADADKKTDEAAKPAAEDKKDAKEPLPAVDPEDPGQIIGYIIKGFAEGQWAWAVGLIFMLLMWVFMKFVKERIPGKVTIWVVMALATGTSIAMSLAAGLNVWAAIGSGVTVGLAAGGGWSAIGKYILPTKKKADAKATAAAASAESGEAKPATKPEV